MNITSTGMVSNIASNAMNTSAVNSEQEVYNRIKNSKDTKEQLKKSAQEFESIFITKMLSEMEESVDKSGGLFDEKSGGYLDSFKPYMFQELGRDLVSNPHTTFGFAKTIYEQMEKYVK